jgi:hexosaminidase
MKIPKSIIVFSIALTASLHCSTLYGQQGLIPKPLSITSHEGAYTINKNTKIFCTKEANKTASILAAVLRKSTGYKLPIVEPDDTKGGIHIILTNKIDSLGKEGYRLEVTNQKVILSAAEVAGVFNGSQTLRQLLPPQIESDFIVKNNSWKIPAVSIADKPRYDWRGYMQDVSRTFYNPTVIKKYIDVLSLYKINTLHLHLTDDQGWRIEIKKYPKLTAPQNTVFQQEDKQPIERSGFYTQEEIKDIVQYASDRNIKVIPEIDIPGHSWPTILAYPELGVNKKNQPNYVFPFLASWSHWGNQFTPNTLDPTSEKVYEFLDGVFGEIATLFPADYIHFGGDEVRHSTWDAEAHVNEFMKKNGMVNSGELQNYFVARVSKIIKSKGKKPIGWNDILKDPKGLTKETAIMSWLGDEAIKEAASNQFYTVATPTGPLYLDITQADRNDGTMSDLAYSDINSTEAIYNYDPATTLKPDEEKYVLGIQANMWTAIPQEVKDMNVQNFPRLLALSEIAWTAKGKRNFENFEKRLEKNYPRLDQLKMDYYHKGGYIFGKWTPKDLTNDYKSIEWDVTKKVYTEGRITSGFFFTEGKSFMNIRKVGLYANGKLISEDIHEGLADKFRGTHKTKTFQYYLEVKKYDPKAKYTVKAEVSGQNGTDSYGNFTFNLSPYKPFTVAETK